MADPNSAGFAIRGESLSVLEEIIRNSNIIDEITVALFAAIHNQTIPIEELIRLARIIQARVTAGHITENDFLNLAGEIILATNMNRTPRTLSVGEIIADFSIIIRDRIRERNRQEQERIRRRNERLRGMVTNFVDARNARSARKAEIIKEERERRSLARRPANSGADDDDDENETAAGPIRRHHNTRKRGRDSDDYDEYGNSTDSLSKRDKHDDDGDIAMSRTKRKSRKHRNKSKKTRRSSRTRKSRK